MVLSIQLSDIAPIAPITVITPINFPYCRLKLLGIIRLTALNH